MDPDVKRLFEEFNQFNRDMLNRFDRSWSAIDRRIEAQTRQMQEQAGAMRQQAAAMRQQAGAMRDMRAEIQANTQGLLRVLDELRGTA